MRQFYFFCLAGGSGFICDYFIFVITHEFVNAYLAKPIGFFCAVQLTYFINKLITFADRTPLYLIYILGQIKGFLINFLVFSAVYYYTQNQYIGFFIAAGITLLFNFYYAKYFAFKS